MKFEISEEVLHNLFVFLDRVEIKGLKELSAMNMILDTLNNPMEEGDDENNKSK